MKQNHDPTTHTHLTKEQIKKIPKEALKHYNGKWITLKQLEKYLENLK